MREPHSFTEKCKSMQVLVYDHFEGGLIGNAFDAEITKLNGVKHKVACCVDYNLVCLSKK